MASRREQRAHAVAVVRRGAAILLQYPDRPMRARLPHVQAALRRLPRGTGATTLTAAGALRDTARHIGGRDELELAQHYVATFDLRRRRTLHLTYYTHGDTRNRGAALAELSRYYAAHGWRVCSEELPDHLAVVLEFASAAGTEPGGALLQRFRPAVDLLRDALHRHDTPYARVLDAVTGTLPPPRPEQRRQAALLARSGPPTEAVGLAAPPAAPRPSGGAGDTPRATGPAR